ncbi:MAG TPA: hemerythrin family protein [Anaeromyxobacteraceae bacterium]|nr:hemerythrin family protein [Anaeromyxobacteraceae bacterium]
MPIQWTPWLELGIPELDAQHLQLDDRLAALHEAFCEGRVPDVPEVIAGVRELAGRHFGAELRRMEELRYEHVERHVAEHRRFSEQLDHFEARCLAGVDVPLAMEVANWLAAWIREHQRWDLELRGPRGGAPRP